MAFTWVHSTNVGDYVKAIQITEIKNNMNTLSTSITTPTPSVTPISFVEPLVQYTYYKDPVMDELQLNLNYLKSENYCRDYYSNKFIGDFTTNETTDQATDYIARHTDKHMTDNGTDHADRYATRHGSKYDTRYASRYDYRYSTHRNIHHTERGGCHSVICTTYHGVVNSPAYGS